MTTTSYEIAAKHTDGRAVLIGYSVSSITDYELGCFRSSRKPIDPPSMQRYRMACAAVAADLAFDWRTCKATFHRSETVDLMHWRDPSRSAPG